MLSGNCVLEAENCLKTRQQRDQTAPSRAARLDEDKWGRLTFIASSAE